MLNLKDYLHYLLMFIFACLASFHAQEPKQNTFITFFTDVIIGKTAKPELSEQRKELFRKIQNHEIISRTVTGSSKLLYDGIYSNSLDLVKKALDEGAATKGIEIPQYISPLTYAIHLYADQVKDTQALINKINTVGIPLWIAYNISDISNSSTIIQRMKAIGFIAITAFNFPKLSHQLVKHCTKKTIETHERIIEHLVRTTASKIDAYQDKDPAQREKLKALQESLTIIKKALPDAPKYADNLGKISRIINNHLEYL